MIIVNSQKSGERVMPSITYFIERKLKLKVNNTKSQVVPINQYKFLRELETLPYSIYI